MSFGGGSGGGGSIAGNSDVVLNNLSDNQYFVYNATSAKWENKAAAWRQLSPGDSIQAAIDAGAQAILLSPGEWTISSPIVPSRACTIRGVGQSTRIRATASMPAVFAVGNGGALDGVQISDLVVDCDGLADVGIDINTEGTTGNYQGEPDSVHRFDSLWVYDAVTSGVWLRGTDTQAAAITRTRVRRAGTYGFRVEAPDNWIAYCEATTNNTATGAGFYCGGANCFFEGNKAWYCRNYGWHIRCTRSSFTNNHSQDTRNHGWYVEWDKNTFTGCIADSASYGGVGGTPNGADGWYFEANNYTVAVGCMGFDRQQGYSSQQRYGFNVPAAMVSSGRFTAYTGYDNLTGLINQR